MRQQGQQPRSWTMVLIRGSPPASRCVVVDVSLTGDWTLERRPAHSHYP